MVVAAKAYQRPNSRVASSKHAIKTRIALIGSERKIPKAEIVRAQTTSHYEIMKFCTKYGISFDWILFGDLTGLLRTVRRIYPPGAPTDGRAA